MWEDIFNNSRVCGFGGGKISFTEGKRGEDYIDAITRAYLTPEDQLMLKISANHLQVGGHIHLGVDEGIGESWMDRRRISPSINAVTSGIGSITVQCKVLRECPPNKVVKYTQLVWNIAKSARDNLATMTVNEYYKISGKTIVQVLENAKPERFELEIWFEDDRKFHVYRNDKRIFESKSAKETAAFIEGGLK